MKTGIMQPYFFPYLGYWQLMNEVDTYVIFDDVAFIRGGWIKRNQIKINGQVHRIGISVKKASQNKRINELYLVADESEKLLRTLEVAYRKAPYYDSAMKVLEKSLCCGRENLAEYLSYSIRNVAEYLEMDTNFILSSKVEKDESLRAQDRVLDICKRVGTDTYINAIGGRELYNVKTFAENGIRLEFLEMNPDITYPQGQGEFIPGLSIIDVMMYNTVEEIKKLLKQFTLR